MRLTKEDFEVYDKEIHDFYLKIGMRSGENILPYFVAANLISNEQIDNLGSKIIRLTKIIDRIVNLFLEKNRFEDQFNLPEEERRLIEIPRGFKSINIFCRFDLFLYDDGFKVIEINPESPSGMGRTSLIDKIFLKQEPFKDMESLPDARQFLLEGLLSTYEEWGGKNKSPTIALVDLKGIKTISDQNYIKEYFEDKGYKTIVCSPEELRSDNGLFFGEDKVDIVYRRFITTEYLRSPDIFKDVLEALKKNEICMINPFASRIIDDKSLLSRLREGVFDEVLTDAEKDLVAEIIPWSIEINPGTIESQGGNEKLLRYILKNKDGLVLKPSIAYGGVDVFIGEDTSKEDWEIAVKKALYEMKWIVQEYLRIPTIEVPSIKSGKLRYIKKYINLCPFIVNNAIAGFVTRISSSKIINTTQGGGMIPTFIR